MRDAGNSYLTAEGVDADPESPMSHLLGSSITYRIAVGPQQGRKVFTLQTLPDCRTNIPAGIRQHRYSGVGRTVRLMTSPSTSRRRRAAADHLCSNAWRKWLKKLDGIAQGVKQKYKILHVVTINHRWAPC